MSTYWTTKWSFLRLSGAAILGFIDLNKDGALPEDMFVLKGVDGLGPPEIDVSISKKKFQARQPRDRQLVVRIGLNPDYVAGDTPSDLRAYLYGMLTGDASNAQVTTFLMVDAATELFRTEGYVSKIENNPFSKDPEVAVTIECMGPYFHDAFERDALVDGDFGQFDPNPQWPNRGSAPSGFYLEGKVTASYDYFEIKNGGYNDNGSEKRMRFNWFDKYGVHAVTNSLIQIDTREGQRMARLLQYLGAGPTYEVFDLLSAMTSDSVWLQLHNDMNNFTTNLSSVTWQYAKYTPQHWGI